MPKLMISLILAGFMLQITTTRRSRIFSIGTNFTRPLTTCSRKHAALV